LPTLGGEACAIAFAEKHTADRIIKNLIITLPLRLAFRHIPSTASRVMRAHFR
jgi:hypothetical protein